MDDAQVSKTIGGATKCGGVRPAINWGDDRLPERFWDKVSPCPVSGCWLWTAGMGRYGTVPSFTTYNGGRRTKTSARRMFFLALDVPLSSMRLKTTCGVDICVNPAHSVFKTAETQEANRRAKQYAYNRSERGREIYRRAAYLKRYGITLEERDRMIADQDGKCAICARAFDESSARTRSNTDHCHETNRLRDLICGDCNTGLGRFRDSPSLLRAAADYLEKHGKT